MARGKAIFEPPRFMTVVQAVEQLLEIEDKNGEKVYGPSTIAVGLGMIFLSYLKARVGCDDQLIISGTMAELLHQDFKAPLHSLVIAGKLHFLEAEAVREFAVDAKTFDQNVELLQ
jgi:diphthine synthase